MWHRDADAASDIASSASNRSFLIIVSITSLVPSPASRAPRASPTPSDIGTEPTPRASRRTSPAHGDARTYTRSGARPREHAKEEQTNARDERPVDLTTRGNAGREAHDDDDNHESRRGESVRLATRRGERRAHVVARTTMVKTSEPVKRNGAMCVEDERWNPGRTRARRNARRARERMKSDRVAGRANFGMN